MCGCICLRQWKIDIEMNSASVHMHTHKQFILRILLLGASVKIVNLPCALGDGFLVTFRCCSSCLRLGCLAGCNATKEEITITQSMHALTSCMHDVDLGEVSQVDLLDADLCDGPHLPGARDSIQS